MSFAYMVFMLGTPLALTLAVLLFAAYRANRES